MNWTSRERVAATLERREPDRVPISFNPLHDFYVNLKAYLGLDIEEQVKPDSFMEVIPDPRVLAAVGADLISVRLGAPSGRRTASNTDDLKTDEWGVVRKRVRQPGGGSYMEVIHHPLAEATLADLESYPWPDPDAPGRGEGAEAAARRLYEDTGLALMGRFGGSINEQAMFMVGMETWYIRMKREPEFAAALLDKITDVQIRLDRIGLEATARYLQIHKVSGEDLGTQTGPFMSLAMFRQLLLPRLSRRWHAARTYLDTVNPSVKLMLHSCGSIRAFIPDLVASGIQLLDPLQPRAAHMDSAELKREFGDCLSFHGGVDIQYVLPFGTPEEIEQEVRRRIGDYAPGGGYILAPSHFVQADTSPASFMTMIRAAREFGQYPTRC